MKEKFDIEADFNVEKEQPVFVYCDTGSTSILAARKLDSMGIHAYNVVGGIMFYKGYLEKGIFTAIGRCPFLNASFDRT